MRTWIWLLATLLITGAAQAEPTWLEFEQLEGVRSGDQVEVRYRVAAESWQRLTQSGEKAQLITELLAEERRSRVSRTVMEQPAGQFRIFLPEDMDPHTVRFALQHSAHNRFFQAGVGVVTLSRGLGAGSAVAPARSPARVARHAQDACSSYGEEADTCREIIARDAGLGASLVVACAEQGRNRLDCLRNSINKSTDMSSAVRACADLVAGVDERKRCVAAAAKTQHDPASLVRACGRGFETPAARLGCVTAAAATYSPATGLVEQCVFAFEGPIARLDCITLGQTTPVDLASGVAACRQAISWANPRRRCVEAAAQSKTDLASAIIACRSGARSPAAVLQCVQTAARGNDGALLTTIHGCSRAADDADFNACVAQGISPR